jgi:hypothetical protein
MTDEQIGELISQGKFPETTQKKELVETHISWVILCDRVVYKIKKPIQYPFLDFSTLELRRHFCKRELELNQRMSENVYLEVLPIHELNGVYIIGGSEGTEVDCALKMRKLDPQRQMDVLLARNMVSPSDIKALAERIVDFHNSAKIIYETDVLDISEKFNALSGEKEFLSQNLDKQSGKEIDRAIETSDVFLNKNKGLLEGRLKADFFRDCHGDLHTRNIFLLPAPLPFDCIEFNDSYRQIDVLNEVAFLCMDLDALDRKDLSELFISYYDQLFPVMRNKNERQLFIYYKSYRANVRAKVNSLRAKSASDEKNRSKALTEARKYLKLMDSYVTALDMY